MRNSYPRFIEQVERRLLLAFGDDLLIFYSVGRTPEGIYTATPDGNNATHIPTPHAGFEANPQFNDSKTRILYSAIEDNSQGADSSEIYIANADGSGEVQLTDNDSFDGDACFSPDGSQIVFVSERDGNREIYRMNADGSNQTRLTNDAGTDGGPVFHPSGKVIAFHSDRDGDQELFTLNLSTGDTGPLTDNNFDDFDPAFNPLGTAMTFISERDHPDGEVYVTTDFDFANAARRSNNEDIELTPTFSPDGLRIAFGHIHDFGSALEVVRVDGGPPFITVFNGYGDEEVQWASAPAHAVLFDDDLTVWGTTEADTISLNTQGLQLIVTRSIAGHPEADASATYESIEVDKLDIFLREGNDVLLAEASDGDSLAVRSFYAIGGPGDDVMVGGDQDDTLTGGSGRNTLFGGNGNDRLNGSSGRDFLYGDGGNDRLYGNAGNDYLVGGGNVDRIWGGNGDDFISGNGQNDKLSGEAGNDQIFGGAGNDYLDGGPGGATDIDILHGQAGYDTANNAPEDELFSIESF